MTRPRRRRSTESGGFHVVLLAGGSGTRFWPMSRARRPKQFLALAGPRSLLRATWDRARSLAPPSRIWVVAPRALSVAVRRELPDLVRDRLVVEPSPRDTGPAIALACAAIARLDPSACVAVLPTDHVVRDARAFGAAVRAARRAAAAGALVCLGVTPDRPATGFGYLHVASKPRAGVAARVTRFVEKPGAARARRFVSSGRYLWNGGMFVWSVRAFFDELGRVAPAIAAVAASVAGGSTAAWRRAPRISIDYALMEKASRVVVVPLDAGWDDVGSWDAAARLAAARGKQGDAPILLASPDSAVFGGGRLVAVLGVRGVVVVDTPDAVLVVARDAGERMRDLVRAVKDAGRDDLL